MEHKIVDNHICNQYVMDVKNSNLKFDDWWLFCGNYYLKNAQIPKAEFSKFKYSNGLNIGDVMVLYGKNPKDINVGDILIFNNPKNEMFQRIGGPVIHRVIKKWKDKNGKYHFQTKGDHNPASIKNLEEDIKEEYVIGVPILRIPIIGYVKLAGYEAVKHIKGLI